MINGAIKHETMVTSFSLYSKCSYLLLRGSELDHFVPMCVLNDRII